MGSSKDSSARAIIENLGGPENISSLTHCATRLRFELGDVAKINEDKIDKVPGVLGVVHQGDNRYQVICGGGVESMYTAIKHLPEMQGAGVATKSNADVKAEARSKARGKYSWLDNFFEYLSDSFRPILGVLLGASLIIAIAAVLDGLKIVDFRADDKSATWVFVDAMWRSVFYFLPIMVAYNAAKKLRVDPWLGAAVMGALMTPEFMSLKDTDRFADTVKTVNETLGTESFTANVFGFAMQHNDYGGQVFVPLIMVAILALVYHGLKKIFPENVQMVFVPFISMLIMIPLTAFIVGPLGVWLGTGIGSGLAWMNSNAPFVFAILIPMLYPFLVPLGLHWPLNALMLVNIQTLGYDFIQGPMGAWNFACFGATAGVLVLSLRDRDVQMRQTATGALAAGLFGGISEPSLYGIHLRFKRVYPRMLLGCFAGGLTIAILSAPYGGVKTNAFVFTSLITTVVFKPIWVYLISIAVAFFVAMFAIILTDYRTPEEKAEAEAARAAAQADADAEAAEEAPLADDSPVAPATATTTGAGSAAGVATAVATKVEVAAPVAGEVISLDAAGDKVFASRALGEGVGIKPTESRIVAPVSGTLMTVAKTGHAFGIKTDDDVEVLVHVGIDTVKMAGEGFEVKVEKKQRVNAGDLLAEVDFDKIVGAGYPTTTIMTVTNTKKLASVEPKIGSTVRAGDAVIEVRP
ncbi:glucose PTS transporter subunit IIA [Corynebacterium lactis]|uniref:PTS mannose transporter subunit IIABC n=1 Tax=Corynebacterium lactis RW2-5 TaxID=1408189 RepID=A0A0K2H0Z2_9CORY|nr:glucose PTS transporter subunit IIA [Corynebacterium lactis]ALA67699.1 PTS mannose transporter subunit IIABC [Corynebacterium lactis RW2-5]